MRIKLILSRSFLRIAQISRIYRDLIKIGVWLMASPKGNAGKRPPNTQKRLRVDTVSQSASFIIILITIKIHQNQPRVRLQGKIFQIKIIAAPRKGKREVCKFRSSKKSSSTGRARSAQRPSKTCLPLIGISRISLDSKIPLVSLFSFYINLHIESEFTAAVFWFYVNSLYFPYNAVIISETPFEKYFKGLL